MLIWGWKARYKVLAEGTFFCPHDGGDRPYQRKEARRWFTFFFIPIIPLKVLGEFVECQSCQTAYDPVVLTAPTAGEMMDNLANATRHAVVAIVKADGHVDPAERDAALRIMQEHSDTPYTSEDLERDLAELAVGDLTTQLAAVAGYLNEPGKERLLTGCVGIAAADGHIDDNEVGELEKAGAALGMSRAHIRGIIATVREQA